MSHGDGTNQRPGNATNIADVPKLYDENDRLRAELATWKKAHIELGEMYDRLRAENAMARVFFQAILDSGQRGYPADLAIEFLAKTAKTAKEGEITADADRAGKAEN